jgi:hypothetical protein
MLKEEEEEKRLVLEILEFKPRKRNPAVRVGIMIEELSLFPCTKKIETVQNGF